MIPPWNIQTVKQSMPRSELSQWLFFELVHSLRIISILPTYKLAGLTKDANDVHKKLNLVGVWN